MRFRISAKISILVGALAAIVSISIGSVLHYGSTEIIFNQSLERLKYETNIRAIKLINDIDGLSRDALYLVGTPPIAGIPRSTLNQGIDPIDGSTTEIWTRRLETIFTELIRAKPNYQQIRLITVKDNGRELVRVDRKGSMIVSIPDAALQQKGDTEYFKRAVLMNSGEVYLSNISLNREHGVVTVPHQPVIRAATPIYFNQELYAILVINMNFSSIFKDLIDSTPRLLTPYITNEQGYFLANPDNSKTFGFDLDGDQLIFQDYPSVNFYKTNDVRDKEYTFFEPDNELDVIHVVKAPFDPQHSERFFGVALATSKNTLLEESNRLRNYAFTFVTLMIVGILLVSATLARRLMQPLRNITQAAEDLADGREVENLPTSNNDEIGELARAFDFMHRQLGDKEQALLATQAESHQANKMASLGEMASGMAHEINSPLLEINLIAERVKRRSAKGKTQDLDEAMGNIISSTKHMSNIIESLRKISRESEKDAFESCSVEEIINDVLNLSKERYRLKNVKLSINYQTGCRNMTIECQRLQISQVVMNLLNNAFDEAQKQQNKWITIDVSERDSNAVITITDSGKGIEESIRKRIFEPMFTTKEIGEGTGLGLSISASIVENHGGSLRYDEKSKNTRFVMFLPKHTS